MSFTNQEKFSATPSRWALRGDLLDFTAAPAWGETESPAVRFDRDHWLLIEGGRIAEDGPPGRLLAGRGRYSDLHASWRKTLA